MIWQFIALTFAFELGWIPYGELLMYEKAATVYSRNNEYYYPTDVDYVYGSNTFFSDFDLRLDILSFLYAEGGVRVMIHKTPTGISFNPDAIYYRFGLGIYYDPFTLYWEHHCYHPQMTYMFAYNPLPQWEGAYDEIGIRIKLTTKKE